MAHGDISVGLVSKAKATELLGTMVGGYNVKPLIDLLDDKDVAAVAAEGLKKTLLMFDAFHDVADKAKAGNPKAKEVIQSWADAEWFTSRPEVPKSITVTVFKVPGETNTDDLSPAPDAWSRPDIPMHYLAMLKNTRPDAAFKPEQDGVRGPIQFIEDLKKKGHLVAYVGDVVGTGSSRKSATNSVLWFTGEDIPFVPNKRFGGVCLGGKIAPIFYNTMEDAGALPIAITRRPGKRQRIDSGPSPASPPAPARRVPSGERAAWLRPALASYRAARGAGDAALGIVHRGKRIELLEKEDESRDEQPLGEARAVELHHQRDEIERAVRVEVSRRDRPRVPARRERRRRPLDPGPVEPALRPPRPGAAARRRAGARLETRLRGHSAASALGLARRCASERIGPHRDRQRTKGLARGRRALVRR